MMYQMEVNAVRSNKMTMGDTRNIEVVFAD